MREEGRYYRDKAHVQRRERELAEIKKKQAARVEKTAAEAKAADPVKSEAPSVAPAAEGKSASKDRLNARKRPLNAQGRPSASSADDLTDATLRTLYNAYSVAKKRCGETIDVRFEDMASALRKQVPKLLKDTGATSVEFKVVIKQGHASLKAVPKS